MIIWVRGARKSGKTTLATKLQKLMPNSILLDGDRMRVCITKDLGFSEEDRLENNKRIAGLAKDLENQGFPVIVATICPDHVKDEVFYLTGCRFIEL